MDFIDQLKQFSKRVEQLKDQVNTEEATKTSIILPFFQLLGYDIFNPNEFVPEFTADTGIKKGEKVDYAILIDEQPIILIEAKWCGENLEKHDSQLFRYFTTTTSKFAILTNGIIYKFYTDLDEPNKMDEKPFLEVNILDLKENQVVELKKFHKSNFDLDAIFNTASELKYSNYIKQLLQKQLSSPTSEFINYILSEVYSGRRTQNVIDKFQNIVKKSFNQFINEIINERIKHAIESQTNEPTPENEEIEKEETNAPKIVTTLEELECYFIVKSLLKNIIPSSKITYKDTESYFGILLDNNTWKWICRIFIKSDSKYIIIPDENKKGIKYPLDNIEDIYKFKDNLVEVLKRYL